MRYIVRDGWEGGFVVYDSKRQKCLKFRTNGQFSVPDRFIAEKWARIWNENAELRGNRKKGPGH